MENYKLVVIGNLNYPRGSAPSNRTHLYARALIDRGYEVLVICTGSPFKKNTDLPRKGVFEGVDYFYPLGVAKRRFLLIRKLCSAISPFWSLYFLRKKTKNSTGFVVLEFCTSFVQEIIYRLYFVITGTAVIREVNEIPGYKLNPNGFRLKLNLYLHRMIRVRLWDGIIVISPNILKFYQDIFVGRMQKLKILQIPILVNLEEFRQQQDIKREKIIAYAGNLEDSKDGISDLIASFSIVSPEIPDYKLHLAGHISDLQRRNYLASIDNGVVRDKILFTGYLDHEETIRLLLGAEILALARPSTRQTEAGFPTKLGEYLATGNPVVVTKTGEIKRYLSDGGNAYIAEPGEPFDFANQLLRAATDHQKSKEIGENGKKLVESKFDYRIYSPLLIEFISSFKMNDMIQTSPE